MHYLMFAITGCASSSEEARDYVFSTLANDTSFVGEGGLFNSPVADWFVIGGRWSGELTRCLLNKYKLKELNKEFDKKYGWWIGGKKKVTEKQRQKQYEALFKTYFPRYKGLVPAWRNTYLDDGYEDDAMLVTPEVWKKVIAPYIKNKEYKTSWEGIYRNSKFGNEPMIIDIDGDEFSKENIVNNKMIVVIDYHS